MEVSPEAAIGILLTLLCTFIAIYYSIRYPIKLIFIPEDCYGLFNTIVKNFTNLGITYRNNKIGEQVYLLNGYIANIGWRDITKDMVEAPITITLPENYKWLEGNITSHSPDVKIDVNKTNQTLEFDIGIFKRNEHFYFEALLEIPENIQEIEDTDQEEQKDLQTYEMLTASSIKEKITISHRIANTGKISIKDLDNIPKSKSQLITNLLAFIFFAYFLSSAVFFLLLDTPYVKYKENVEYDYEIPLEDGWQKIQISPTKGNNLKLKGIDSEFEEVISYSNLIAKYPKLRPIQHSATFYEKYILPIWILLLLVLIYIDIKNIISSIFWYLKIKPLNL